jgi:aspartate kinase
VTLVVQKYGGSSVADPQRIAQVASHIAATRRTGLDVLAVVSAMGKSTENLLALARSMTREPPKRELDMLVSTGERVTMALLCMALAELGCDAVSFTGSQSGILTDDRHFDAQIVEVRPERIERELTLGRVVIVAGYQGMSQAREITTLGRGGSDTTAVALAAALGAEQCDIYSDVDGVYSADPRTVPDAEHLPALDYETMQEMAEAGARVLNARAVDWAKRHGVVLRARRTADFAEQGAGRETRIESRASVRRPAIVLDHQLAWLEAPRAARDRILAAVEVAGVPIRDAWFDARVCLLLSLTSVPDFERAKNSLLEAGARVVSTEIAAVSAVGVGIGRMPEPLRRALAYLPPSALATFVTPLRLTAIVPSGESPVLERSWHALFASAQEC